MNGRASLRHLALLLLLAANAAQADLVLVTSASNSAFARLSIKEAEQLYLGHRTTLADGTPVLLIDLPAGTDRDHFYHMLTGKNPNQTRAYWSRQVFTGRALPPREAGSINQARQWIATTPGMIGYLPDSALDDSVSVLLRLPR